MADAEPTDAEPTDLELLRRHVVGDPEAFGALFTRHRDRLWAVALRTLGDPDDAGDALQEAMVSAFRRAGSYRGDAAVTSWLHRIVVNACLDLVRRSKVRATQALPEDADRMPELAVVAPDPADQLTRRSSVLSALRQLSPEQRHALVLVDMEGYSVDEAAEMMRCAPGTVKSRCARGRARLLPLLAHLRNREPALDVPPVDAPEPGRGGDGG